jgi:cytoskeleton protein RodZ
MLALFNMEYSSREPSIDGFKRSEKNSEGVGAWFKSLLLLVILVAGAWFAYQYWLEMEHQAQQTEATAPVLPGSEDENTFDNSFNASIVEPLPAVESEQITSIEPAETIEISVVETQAAELPTEETEEFVMGELLNTDTPEAMDNIELTPPEQQDALVNAEEMILVAVEPEVITETKMLVMVFSADCWVEISDRNNKKLLHKTVLAGEAIELSGKWPLQVLLGNAKAVAVRYNDSDFDIAPHIRANVARFSVGEATE